MTLRFSKVKLISRLFMVGKRCLQCSTGVEEHNYCSVTCTSKLTIMEMNVST